MKIMNIYRTFFFIFALSTTSLCIGAESDNKQNPENPPAVHQDLPVNLEHVNPSTLPKTDPFEHKPITEGKEDDRFLNEFMHMLTALGLIIGGILIVSWFMKSLLNSRVQKMNETSEIKVLERRALTPKTTIYLLDVKGKGVAIAESHNGITRLADFQLDVEGSKSSFEQVLEDKMNKK